MPTPTAHLLDQAANILQTAKSVLFITGAGLSADSGMPTYRGIGGLYEGQKTPEGMSIEQALSGQTLKRHPEVCWRYIHQLEKACRGAQPNAAHHVIAALEKRTERLWVLTQNVDALHHRAGSEKVVDIHGGVGLLLCTACDYEEKTVSYEGLAALPQCPKCDAVLRPDVVLFGEMLPRQKVHTLEEQLAQGFDAVFSVGTSSVFPYIAGPVIQAQSRGKKTVEINPGRTSISDVVDLKIPLGAAKSLKEIAKRLEITWNN